MWKVPRPQKPEAVLHGMGAGAPSVTSPHILASPPGTPAPIDSINYTPKTGEVHGPGVLAPVHEMNYSLLPSHSMGAGGGFSAGMGMGAGAAPPGLGSSPVVPGQERLTGRYTPAPSMATGSQGPGTPPIRPSPYGTGPGIRSRVSGPASTAFSERGSGMSGNLKGWGAGTEMGAGDGPTGPQDTSDLGGAAAATTGSAPNASAGQGGAVTGAPAPAGAPTPTTPADDQEKPATPIPPGWSTQVDGDGSVGSIVWLVSPDGSTKLPAYFVRSVDAASHTPVLGDMPAALQTSILGKTGAAGKVKTVTTTDSDGKRHIHVLNSDGTLGADVALAPQPAAPKPPATNTRSPGQHHTVGNLVYVTGPDGIDVIDQAATDANIQAKIDSASHNDASVQAEAIRAAAATASDKPYTQVTLGNGQVAMVNTENPTGPNGVITLGPADVTRGVFTAGNAIFKISDDGTGATLLAQAPKGFGVTTTTDGHTIAYNQDDPTQHFDMYVDPNVAPKEQADIAQVQAQTAKLQQDVLTGQISNEDARAKLAVMAHDLLHPQIQLTAEGYIAPPGSNTLIDYGGYGGKGVEHVDMGPADPEAQKVAANIQTFLDTLGKPQQQPTPTAAQGTASTQPTTTAAAGTTPGAAVSTPGGPSTTVLPPGEAGTAEDPLISQTGLTQPAPFPAKPVSATSGIPEGSNRLDPRSSLPSSNVTSNPQIGSTLNVGVTPTAGSSPSTSGGTSDNSLPDDGSLNLTDAFSGAGQDTFQGRGLTPQAGRGSTGVGWNPKPRMAWTPPGAGHMAAGGRGGAGMSGGGGAGADEGGDTADYQSGLASVSGPFDPSQDQPSVKMVPDPTTDPEATGWQVIRDPAAPQGQQEPGGMNPLIGRGYSGGSAAPDIPMGPGAPPPNSPGTGWRVLRTPRGRPPQVTNRASLKGVENSGPFPIPGDMQKIGREQSPNATEAPPLTSPPPANQGELPSPLPAINTGMPTDIGGPAINVAPGPGPGGVVDPIPTIGGGITKDPSQGQAGGTAAIVERPGPPYRGFHVTDADIPAWSDPSSRRGLTFLGETPGQAVQGSTSGSGSIYDVDVNPDIKVLQDANWDEVGPTIQQKIQDARAQGDDDMVSAWVKVKNAVVNKTDVYWGHAEDYHFGQALDELGMDGVRIDDEAGTSLGVRNPKDVLQTHQRLPTWNPNNRTDYGSVTNWPDIGPDTFPYKVPPREDPQPWTRGNQQLLLPDPRLEGGVGQDDPLYHYASRRRGMRQDMGAGQDPTSQSPGGPPGAPSPGQTGGPQPPQGGQGWTPPVPPQAVAGIGHRFGQQMNQGEPQHSGVDLQAQEGTSTISPVDGSVERIENNPQGLGLTVVIRGKDGSEHRLGHLSTTHVYPGMLVSQGQDIAKVGSTGNATGSHLHWGVKTPDGQPQDPTGALPPQLQNAPPVPGTKMMGPPGGTGGQAQMGAPQMGGGQEQQLDDYPITTPAPLGQRQQGDVMVTSQGAMGWNQPQGGQGFWAARGPLEGKNETGEVGESLTYRPPQQQPRPLPQKNIGFGVGQGSSPLPGQANTSSPDYQQGYQDGIQASRSPGTPPVFVPGLQQPVPMASDDQSQMGGGQESSVQRALRNIDRRAELMNSVSPSIDQDVMDPNMPADLWGIPPGTMGNSVLRPLTYGSPEDQVMGGGQDESQDDMSWLDPQAYAPGSPIWRKAHGMTVNPWEVKNAISEGASNAVLPKGVRDTPMLGGMAKEVFDPAMVPGASVGGKALDVATEKLAMPLIQKLIMGGVSKTEAEGFVTEILAKDGVQGLMKYLSGEAMSGSAGAAGGATPASAADMGGGQDEEQPALPQPWYEQMQADIGQGAATANRQTQKLLSQGWTLDSMGGLNPPKIKPLGGGQESADTRWDMYQARDTQGFMGPANAPTPIGAGAEPDPTQGPIDMLPMTEEEKAAWFKRGFQNWGRQTPWADWWDEMSGQAAKRGLGSGADEGGDGGSSDPPPADPPPADTTPQPTSNPPAQPQPGPAGPAGPSGPAGPAAPAPTPPSQTGVTPNQNAADQTSQANTAATNAERLREAQIAAQTQAAQIAASIQAENDRHNEFMANLQQQMQFHQDDVRLQEEVNAETTRHNQALEKLQEQQTQMQQTLEQMREANAVQLQQMQEGTQIYLQQGQQAFQDWQTQQADRMQILSSALSNPWLQMLSGMSPAGGQPGAAVGGADITKLLNQILQPYNNQYGVQNAPAGTTPPGQTQPGGASPGASAQGGAAQGGAAAQGAQPTTQQMGLSSTTQAAQPSWAQWQGWSPYQKAAYRTDIEAQGPGAWSAEQANLQNQFQAAGGSPDVTAMQAAAASPEQQIGQQMTAQAFGQTTPEWQQNQQRQWSKAVAPSVKQNLSGIAA